MKTATQQLSEYAAGKASVEAKLNELGTSSAVMSEQINAAIVQATAFAGDVIARTALYDQLVNIPCGVHSRAWYKPESAFKRALAGACGAAVKWDINQALELAADILEDVNAHGEAAKVREWIKE